MKHFMLVFGLLFIAVILSTDQAQAKKWEQQGKFKGNEHFEFKVTTTANSGEEETITYILDFKKSGAGYQASYTTIGNISADELGMQAAYGLMGLFGISLSAILINPMSLMYFQQLELTVGEKMSLFGAGIVKVVGKETVGGVDGYICEFYQTEGNEEKLISTTTVNPDLPLPIRSKMEGSEVVLLKYSTN